MKSILEGIQQKLIKNSYKNEEQIRLSLVSRVLLELGWDIWNPSEVRAEFKANEEGNDRKRIDLALFIDPFIPPIYFEIKTADKLSNETELRNAEKQLRDYNKDFTALFTILTDGYSWRFYYSQEGGSFDQKCFKIVNIQHDDISDIEFTFLSFLSKEKIKNGYAKREAYKLLQMTKKQRVMQESLPDAKRVLERNPLKNLVEALCDEVKAKGVNITTDEAIEFLTNMQSEKEISQGINDKQERFKSVPSIYPTTNNLSDVKSDFIYTPKSSTKLKFTKTKSCKIENEYASDWQKATRTILRNLISRNIPINEIKNITKWNISSESINDKGFHQVPGTNYFLQNVEIPKAAEGIFLLANKYNIQVEIEFFWNDKPGAAHPGRTGKLVVG